MKKITDTVLIFGKSYPFMNEIDIEKLLNLGYTTFAINNHEFETDYVAFVDTAATKKNYGLKSTVITQSRHSVREPVIYFDDFSYDFTHDYLLKWLHGRCARAVLIGAADFVGDRHYDSDIKFTYCKSCKKRSKKFIEGIKDIKVYKMNPNGILDIPVWDFEKEV